MISDLANTDAPLDEALTLLRNSSGTWLVTGSAGFIGSHLLEALLREGRHVVSVDNFATGHRRNLDDVRSAVGDQAWSRHTFIEGDLLDPAVCTQACQGVRWVLHQAALGSVPRSLSNPQTTHAANITASLNLLVVARDAGVHRLVYAASSSTYGDSATLPKVEGQIGRPLSPYAVTKLVNELYAEVFARCYGLTSVGLRYFNVFGPRQDPNGAYAAVIPRWAAAMLSATACTIHGDGQTSRDFSYVANVVQANLRAALCSKVDGSSEVYNIAVGQRMSLIELHAAMAQALCQVQPGLQIGAPCHSDFRAGDVRHSLADIGKARQHLGYVPTHDVRAGIQAAMRWYLAQHTAANRGG